MTLRENHRPVRTLAILVLLGIWLFALACREQPPATRPDCRPTPADELGPFYRPNAPEREAVGQGYLLTGTVLAAGACRPLGGARIEFWLVNPQGDYDDAHRATVFADRWGRYRFKANRPTDYVGRLPHIHLKVTAAGHEQLITQHYPAANTSEGVFDLVLAPAAPR
jgi:protocatechuate 3,4-dioxygenase beta subunit